MEKEWRKDEKGIEGVERLKAREGERECERRDGV